MADREPGARWVRIKKLYATLALMVLNTLLLVIAIELAATVVNAIHPPRNTLAETVAQYKQRMLNMNYYYTQDWASTYWDEHLEVVDHWRYHAYTVWRTPEFTGELINVDENGIRYTPGSDCEASAYRIAIYGGSTMWGFGSPDWGTIPAYLQARMEDRPVCVVNRAELGFNSTQSMIDLIQLIERGDIPDMVIFYDGINDIYAALQENDPGAHYFVDNIAPAVKGGLVNQEPASAVFAQWLLRTQTARMLLGEPPLPEAHWATEPFDPALVDGITDLYLTNIEIVSQLAERYDFDFFAFVQPVLPTFNRPDSPYAEEEQIVLWNTSQSVVDMFGEVYPRWQEAAETNERLFYFGDVLDGGHEYPFWIDFQHVTPWGNLIIAHEIGERILPTVDAALAQ